MKKNNGASAFEERFKNKISVVNKDGSRTHVATGEKEYEPPATNNEIPVKRAFKPLITMTSTRSQDSSRSDKRSVVSDNRTLTSSDSSQNTSARDFGRELPKERVQRDMFREYKENREVREVREVKDVVREPRELARQAPPPIDVFRDDNNSGGEEKSGYAKKHRQVKYKPHTLEEYKVINQPIKLGGLGADLSNEKLREKKDKLNRMKDYGREIAMAHHMKSKTKEPVEERIEKPKQTVAAEKKVSSRQRAIDFASKITKPQIKRIPKQEEKSNAKRPSYNSDDEDMSGGEPEPLTELEMLEMKHQQERAWVEREFSNYVL